MMEKRATILHGARDYIIPLVTFLSTFLLIVGCTSTPGEITAGVGEKFSLNIGQSASITGEDLNIKFVEVITDSRCPGGAVCIWQGEVICLVEITYLSSSQRMALTQPGLTENSSKAEFNNYEITFNVEPYPVVGKEVKDSDYKLQMTIDKKPILTASIPVTFDVISERYSIFIKKYKHN